MLRQLGGDRFIAVSAGSHPCGFVHPLAIETLRVMGMPHEGRVSKSWEEFAGRPLDAVITLCDAAAQETCPVWPGHPLTAHWSLPDPVQHPGTPEERLRFARSIGERLRSKIAALVELDWSQDRATIQKRLKFLGEI